MKLSTLSSYIDTILENEKAKAEFKKQNENKEEVEQQDLLSIHDKHEAFWNELEFETKIEGEEDAEREKNLKTSIRSQGETFQAFEKLLDQSSSEKQVAILDCPDIMNALYKNNCFIQELRSRYIERLKKNLGEWKTEVEKAQGFPMVVAVNHAIRCSHQFKSFAINFSNLKQDPKGWELCVKKIVELINKNTIRSFSLQNVPKVLDQEGKGIVEILKAIGKTSSIEKIEP